MRVLSWLIVLPLAVATVVFAVANHDGVDLHLWPLVGTVRAPLFTVVISALVIGFLAGALFVATAGYRRSFAAWRAGRRVRILEHQLATVRRRAAKQGGSSGPTAKTAATDAGKPSSEATAVVARKK